MRELFPLFQTAPQSAAAALPLLRAVLELITELR